LAIRYERQQHEQNKRAKHNRSHEQVLAQGVEIIAETRAEISGGTRRGDKRGQEAEAETQENDLYEKLPDELPNIGEQYYYATPEFILGNRSLGWYNGRTSLHVRDCRAGVCSILCVLHWAPLQVFTRHKTSRGRAILKRTEMILKGTLPDCWSSV